MFQLTKDEWKDLIFQNGISKNKRGGRRTLPYAFTEQGISMLSSILNSERAIQINIQIMRTFVQIKRFALENKDLQKRLEDIEQYFSEHIKSNQQDKEETRYHLSKIYEVISLLMDRTKPSKIGFKTED